MASQKEELTKKLKLLTYQVENLEKENARLEQNEFKTHYLAAMDQKNAIEHELVQIQQAFEGLLNSTSWKSTEPLRKIADRIKKNKYGLLAFKGIKSYRDVGLKPTIEKIKNRASHQAECKEYKEQHPFDISPAKRHKQENTYFGKNIKFSIIVPLYNTPLNFLEEMIDSCIDQTYQNWELCLADGSDDKHQDVELTVRDYQQYDNRIKYKKLEKNGGISINTNEALQMATGEYIALFDHDDLLHPTALYEYMRVICAKNADFIYCDELTFEGDVTHIITMHFKPKFAIDNLRANNYICHFSVFKRELLDKVGMFRKEYDGSQDHDMILRLTSAANKVYHIPKILYYWRSHPNSVAADINSKTYAIQAGKNAVKDHLKQLGIEAEIESSKAFPTIYKINYKITEEPLISIIIPNKDNVEQLQTCINSIKLKSTYTNLEIIVIENNSTDQETEKYYKQLINDGVKVLYYKETGFNYSAINNFGVKHATGSYLLFLNNDMEVINPNWIEEMLMYAQRKDVGAVGAKLYYPNDTIQHAGVILKLGAARIAGHAHHNCSKDNLGYMGRLFYAQNFSAVTAACLLIKKSIFDKVGGFDEGLAVAFNDVDFCLKVRKAGFLNIWTPYAELYHYESQSRGLEDTPEKVERFERESNYFREKWGKVLEQGDPYYNINFTLDNSDFSLRTDR
ncbi:MAG: glycosyltransferase [Epulopiscium sp. Nele67-Bin005]|nr:MAG: glycosyltransferase [Epulopiscium sp. Nele67-Bin005]